MNLLKSLIAAVLFTFAAIAFAGEPVDINRADANELTRLNGIGMAKAQAIVEDREANGPFIAAEDLARVQGVGLKTVELNRDLISVGGAPVARTGNSR